MAEYDLNVVDKKLHESIMSKREGIKNELFSYLVESKANELKSMNRTGTLKKTKTTKAKGLVDKKDKVRQKMFAKQIQSNIEAKSKSRMLRRDAMQTKINKRLRELASKLEKEKLIEEKKMIKEFNKRIEKDKRDMIESFSKFWDDQIKMTKESIQEEKLNRKMIELAEKQALSQWRKQLNIDRKKKIDKYFNILEQQDARYEVENLDLSKMEEQLIRMYQKQN